MNTKEFRGTVGKHASGPHREAKLAGIVDDLVTTIESARKKAANIGLSGEEISGLRDRLTMEAEGRWIRTRYATLDLSFTAAESAWAVGRHPENLYEIVGRRIGPNETATEHERAVKLPVFVCEWNTLDTLAGHYEDDDGYRQSLAFNKDVGFLEATRKGGIHRPAVHIHARVKMPSGINEAWFARIRRCVAYLRMFDLLLLDRGLVEPSERDKPEIGVLWAPTDEAWSFQGIPPVPAGDPAILIRRDQHGPICLVGYFDTPDEKPIDNLIREFSAGRIGKRLPKR